MAKEHRLLRDCNEAVPPTGPAGSVYLRLLCGDTEPFHPVARRGLLLHNAPSLTIEANWNSPVRVKWINGLVDEVTGNYLPHLLWVDQTLHWANPPGPRDGRGH